MLLRLIALAAIDVLNEALGEGKFAGMFFVERRPV
jgi:hypothetical protein